MFGYFNPKVQIGCTVLVVRTHLNYNVQLSVLATIYNYTLYILVYYLPTSTST